MGSSGHPDRRGGGPPLPGLREQVRVEMEVVGADGARVGFVKAVGRQDILVDRPQRRDVYVPLAAIREVTGERVLLSIPAGAVDDQGWPSPPLV